MFISNDKKNNHLKELESLYREADVAIITSPFLMEDLMVFFETAFANNLKKLILYTTLPNQLSELIRKSSSLVSAFDFANQQENFEMDIRIVKRLHGKAYLAFKNNNLKKALITSANLTHSGLTKNHEWGITVDDSEMLKSIKKNIDGLSFNSIKEDDVIQLLYRIESVELPEENVIQNIDISDIIDSNIFEEIENEIWLKPIGHTEGPIEPGQKFDRINERLHFSRRRPTGVKLNDIIITYGVGTSGAILSIYKVQSEPIKITEQDIEDGYSERWPWYVMGENLTPQFGNRWWEFNITYTELANEYLTNNPEKPFTDVGSQSFGTFNRGGDKLHLDKEFGNFLYNRIINQAIKQPNKAH